MCLGTHNASIPEELENMSQTDSLATSRPQRSMSEGSGHGYDLLDDIDKDKDIYRLKVVELGLVFLLSTVEVNLITFACNMSQCISCRVYAEYYSAHDSYHQAN